MRLLSLEASQFRNLSRRRIDWGPDTNLVLGMNGAGKTNLLEALGVLGTLRSFRGVGRRSLVQHGLESYLLSGEVETNQGRQLLQQVVTVRPRLEVELSVNRGQVDVAQYLGLFPLTTMSLLDREFIVGAPKLRRRFLDRLAFLLDPSHLENLRRYNRFQHHRNAMLHRQTADAEIASWEQGLAQAAAAVIERRVRAVSSLTLLVADVLDGMAIETFPEVEVYYRPDPWLSDLEGLKALENQYQQRYNENRARDQDAGFTTDGPHRHDLGLRANGRVPRDVLSSGQTKVVGTALKLAAHIVVEQQREESLPIAIDDVDAELDTAVLERFLTSIGDKRQLFLSSAHEELMCERVPKARRFWVKSGKIETGNAVGAGE
ncbi:MAG: DNA replication and repair protein RecF [bacterium]|nr:DNA replication and repair protein RecF [bacterium]